MYLILAKSVRRIQHLVSRRFPFILQGFWGVSGCTGGRGGVFGGPGRPHFCHFRPFLPLSPDPVQHDPNTTPTQCHFRTPRRRRRRGMPSRGHCHPVAPCATLPTRSQHRMHRYIDMHRCTSTPCTTCTDAHRRRAHAHASHAHACMHTRVRTHTRTHVHTRTHTRARIHALTGSRH